MKIAFCTTLNLTSSTLTGRILPLAQELAHQHSVHIIHLGPSTAHEPLVLTSVGDEPFTRSTQDKQRLHGLALVIALKKIALRTAFTLQQIRPDIIVIAKPLPHNTLGVALYHFFHRSTKIFLDVDDFELTANRLTSLAQRAAVHWSERKAAKLAKHIFVATPFLADHFSQLTNNQKIPILVPTGLSPLLLKKLSAVPPATRPSLLYLGSLSTGSGHRVDLLPEILKQVRQQQPATTLTIAGHGDDETALRSAFKQAGLNTAVRWVGRFSPAEVPELVAHAQIILDPIDASITQRAKSSFRTLVAAAAGRPVVTSNVGIRPKLLPGQLHDRLFSEAANPQDYATKTIELLQSHLTENEQINLKKHVAHFSWTELAKHYIKALPL